MDIDQRLAKLAERHEAMMRSLEVTEQMRLRNEEAHRKNEVLLARLIERADSLVQITDVQRRHIKGLEGGPQ
jgi:hypothetical protein